MSSDILYLDTSTLAVFADTTGFACDACCCPLSDDTCVHCFGAGYHTSQQVSVSFSTFSANCTNDAGTYYLANNALINWLNGNGPYLVEKRVGFDCAWRTDFTIPSEVGAKIQSGFTPGCVGFSGGAFVSFSISVSIDALDRVDMEIFWLYPAPSSAAARGNQTPRGSQCIDTSFSLIPTVDSGISGVTATLLSCGGLI